MCDQSIFRNACLFPMSEDQLCTCICNLQSLCRSPDEYFYGVILTPKQTIRIIINSLPIIIEKDYNYNAIPTVSDECFFLSVSRRESAFGPRNRVG